MSPGEDTVTSGARTAPTNGARASDAGDSAANSAGTLAIVGSRVREERLRQKIGLRELARRVGVSASLISQVELGKASPSVGTLYAIVNELGLSLDELFFQQSHGRRGTSSGNEHPADDLALDRHERDRADDAGGESHGQTGRWQEQPVAFPVEPVVRHGNGKTIQLATGVRWERLAPPTPQDVDFLRLVYQPGSESCPPDSLMRHSGHEYGHILSGRMGVTVGFESYELGPGDSVAFDSTMPHRLFTVGDEPVEAIWVVIGRRGDPRVSQFQ